ncbi:MAG: hypothetical protein P8Y01_05860 [Woeseiaceae bacterium]
MAISLTNAAAERVRSYIEQRNDALGLRLGITETFKNPNIKGECGCGESFNV